MKNRKTWERLSIISATLMTLCLGGGSVAADYAEIINSTLGITADISRDEDEAYQYFGREFAEDEYDNLVTEFYNTAEQVEGEGIVLMKNDNQALPLNAAEDKVSTFFVGSINFNYGSSGSSESDSSKYKDLKTALTDAGLEVNSSLWDFYKEMTSYGITTSSIKEVPLDKYTPEVLDSFEDYGTAVVTIGRKSGEGSDLTAKASKRDLKNVGEDGSALSLTKAEVEMLQELTRLKEEGAVKKIVVLLNSSATIQLDFLEREDIDIDACLWVGNVGSNGISAVAKILTGEIVPSGKLSDTYLKDNFSSPAMAQQVYNSTGFKNFAHQYTNSTDLGLDSTQSSYGVYTEGIYVGYRYYETRYTDFVTERENTGEYQYSDDVAYPFGYGLSYTEFEYSDFEVTPSDDDKTYTVSVKVTNKGSEYSGKEAVGIYLQKPYTEYDIENGVEKASVELAAYGKTQILAPGESEILTMTVEESQFKSYDANRAKTYIVDEGTYYLTAANGAHEAANNILAAQGCTPESTDDRMDAEGNDTLVFAVEKEFDDKTYSVSAETGKEITNQLEFADLNKYEGSDTEVTYVSRNDWEGTFPSEDVVLSVTDQMLADLANNQMAPEEEGAEMPKYGQDNGLTLATLRGLSYDDPQWEKLLDQMTFEEQSQLLTNGYTLTVAVDSVAKPDTKEHDGPVGIADSKESLSFPSEGIWASTFNDELVERVGELLAEDVLAAGRQGIYAGGVNIHRTPFGGRSHEYFSEDPYLTAMASVYEILGIQSRGVTAHVKHYAFNENEDSRNGICVWLNEQEAREIMLLPFEYSLGKSEGKADSAVVMSSFNRAGCVWVGASSALMEGILRDEFGFEGYNITDMASSNAAFFMTYRDGLAGGTNLFMGSGTETSLSEFKDSATYASKMREASHRILYTIANKSAAMNGLSPVTSITSGMPWWKMLLIGLQCAFGVLTVAGVLLYVMSGRKDKKEESKKA